MQEKVGSISRSSSIKYVPNSPDQLGNCSILPPIFTHSKKKGFNPVKYFNRGVSAAESWSPSIKSRWWISAARDGGVIYRIMFATQSSKTGKNCSPPPKGAGPTCLIVGSIPMKEKLFFVGKNESSVGQVLWKSYLRVQFLALKWVS